MTSPYDPCAKIYTILSEEWTSFLWISETVFIPQAFREHFVLVLGWTTGRRGYVSVAMITPNIPNGANLDNYIRIQAPRRRLTINESTVTLRKNKAYCVLVEDSYVKLDWVWEVPLVILSSVPRVGMQLMLRAVSMERIMSFYSGWGWDQAWGQTYRSRPESLHSIRQGGEDAYPEMTRQSCQLSNGLESLGTAEQDEALAPPNSIRSLDSANRPDSEEDRHLEQGTPRARQEMVYAGEAHCALLAKLLRERQWRSSIRML